MTKNARLPQSVFRGSGDLNIAVHFIALVYESLAGRIFHALVHFAVTILFDFDRSDLNLQFYFRLTACNEAFVVLTHGGLGSFSIPSAWKKPC